MLVLAQNGLRPIVEFMTWNFAVLALDQILNTASKMLAMSGGQISCPIVFREEVMVQPDNWVLSTPLLSSLCMQIFRELKWFLPVMGMMQRAY